MPEHVRVGVMGTSWWADMMHLPSLASHPGAAAATENALKRWQANTRSLKSLLTIGR